MPIKSGLLIATILIATNVFSQTCIIIVRTTQGICVGTDTKRTIFNNGIYFKTDTACKIFYCANRYYSFAGGAEAEIYSTFQDICDKNLSFSETCDLFLNKESVLHKKWLDELKKDSLNYIKLYPSIMNLEFAIYGYEGNIPKIEVVAFQIVSKPSAKVKLHSYIEGKLLDSPPKYRAAKHIYRA